tara:strand:- start:3007 stop:6573 length:3567 start_codon:yes stop_codon:yes gene_type:complete
MINTFVHLHVHSDFSLIDGVIKVKSLIEASKQKKFPSIALTDRSNMFALIRFYKAAIEAGIKPICGVDLLIRNDEDLSKPHSILFLIQNNIGYKNLTELVSRSFREGQYLGHPMINMDWLNDDSCQGIIALSGGRYGDIGRALLLNNDVLAEKRLDRWSKIFPSRFYLQLTRTGRIHEEDYLHSCIKLAEKNMIPVVATNEVCFLKSDDFIPHEVRVCINDGRTLDDPKRLKNYSDQQYLKSSEEMCNLFSDIPEAIENTVEIAKRCNLELVLGKNFLPDYPVPKGMSIDQFLTMEAHKGLNLRLKSILKKEESNYEVKKGLYEKRLENELSVINGMGFPGYFLIVADFIRWGKKNNVPVGPGRGSGAGSLVAYSLEITDLDPIEFDLLFERFLNPERISMPDFDVDFCMDKRDRVIDYVARTYGRDSVSQIITFGSMAAKAVVRDVGRVLGHPYGFADRVAKMIPLDLGITLTKSLEVSDDLANAYKNDEEVSQLIDMALQLEGLARNASKHAGGVVIAPGRLTDFTPLYCESDGSNLVTQYDKDDVEQAGLVKFDFLGLRTLTIVDRALETINSNRNQIGKEPIKISEISLSDSKCFELLRRAETTAVFQLESVGMKQLITKLKPDCFDDIIALVALFRPGPLQSGMVDNFIARKHGKEKVSYPDAYYQHASLKPILDSTYGIILYQEQVMQIAQVLAGYTLGEADILRRAMGKKKPEEMAKQRAVFNQGAQQNGIDPSLGMKIFDLVEKFAGYGFNKSHSAAYALVSYQTLWLKAHYPAAFMAAVLSSDMDNTDKVVIFVDECRNMSLEVEPPNVNKSVCQFIPEDNEKVIYGLGAIKGVGESAIDGIIEAREEHGNFSDIFDFCSRVDLKKMNRRMIEALIRAGALDQLGSNRATLMMQLPFALKMAEKAESDRSSGMTDLFDDTDDRKSEVLSSVIPKDEKEWGEANLLKAEKEALGLYLTGHPLDRHLSYLQKIASAQIKNISKYKVIQDKNNSVKRKKVIIAGLVVAVVKRSTQRGQMASVLIDDKSSRIECVFFGEIYDNYKKFLEIDNIVVVHGSLTPDDYRGGFSIRAVSVKDLSSYRNENCSAIELGINQNWLIKNKLDSKDFVYELKNLLGPYKGGECKIFIHYKGDKSDAKIKLGKSWSIKLNDEVFESLMNWLGNDAIQLFFHTETYKMNEVVT